MFCAVHDARDGGAAGTDWHLTVLNDEDRAPARPWTAAHRAITAQERTAASGL